MFGWLISAFLALSGSAVFAAACKKFWLTPRKKGGADGDDVETGLIRPRDQNNGDHLQQPISLPSSDASPLYGTMTPSLPPSPDVITSVSKISSSPASNKPELLGESPSQPPYSPLPKTETLLSPDTELLPALDAETLPALEPEIVPSSNAEMLSPPSAEKSPTPGAETSPLPDAETLPLPDSETLPSPDAETVPSPDAEILPSPDAEIPPSPDTKIPPALNVETHLPSYASSSLPPSVTVTRPEIIISSPVGSDAGPSPLSSDGGEDMFHSTVASPVSPHPPGRGAHFDLRHFPGLGRGQ